MTDPIKAPWHLWAVGIVAVLFNGIGIVDYTMSKLQGESYMASAGMTPEQIAFMLEYALWMNVVWPIGVWGAFVASVLLVIRKKLSVPVFMVSTAAWFVSLAYTYLLTSGGEIWGQSMHAISAVITAVLLFLIWYARAMTKSGVVT